MSKLIYLESYLETLCNQYDKEVTKEIKNEFIFNAGEKGTLYARYILLNYLKN